ncbi:MAG TPA: hypothetical protein VFW50_32400 [Streptosporangiaceae bacterium]|nr:hypothetical protein [Streptosporangiaceae bacterium]
MEYFASGSISLTSPTTVTQPATLLTDGTGDNVGGLVAELVGALGLVYVAR